MSITKRDFDLHTQSIQQERWNVYKNQDSMEEYR